MKLTEHFTLKEFEHSETAICRQINNTVPQELIPAIKNLCIQILEPLRMHLNRPVTISSGYRCKELNALIGGAPTSQHTKGEAADIVLPSAALLRQSFKFIEQNCTFDQLIWEHKGRTLWIHISCKPDLTLNRMQAFHLQA